MAGAKLPMKRLVVCCDGTWANSDNGTSVSLDPISALSTELTGKVSLQTPSNVTRIGRCVKQLDLSASEPIQQITYYQAGIGTQNLEDKVLGGATGFGLAEHIREAYGFVAANYNHDAYDVDNDGEKGDEIYLIGFSRGAFTARSIAAFINDVGLLTKAGMTHFYTIFADWENQQKKGWKAPFPDDPFPGHGEPQYNLFNEDGKKKYVSQLVDLRMTTSGVKIKAVAVWDTVGALGLPQLGIFNNLHRESLDYAFVDTSVPKCVDHAIHALSLDENRKPFTPTIWELPHPVPGQTLTQVWFAGAHADVGGSYEDTRAADITLVWMISQLAPLGLVFDKDLLKRQLFKPKGNDEAYWGCGKIHNEFHGLNLLGGAADRTPCDYVRYDHYTGYPRVPREDLERTYEKVHASVRVRWGLKGKGWDGKNYASRALEGWKIEGVEKKSAVNGVNGSGLDVKTIRDKQAGIAWKHGGKTMQEDLLSDLEWEMIQNSRPDIGQTFFSISPNV